MTVFPRLSHRVSECFCLNQIKKFSFEHFSPVENKNDLELDFKVFFFTDSFCSDIVHDESNWCHSGIIERFEKLKMASKMAVSYAPNTYLTNRFDKKSSNFDFLWMFRGLMIQTIKMDLWFDSEGWNIKDGPQDGRHLVPQDLSDQKTQFNIDFVWLFRV